MKKNLKNLNRVGVDTNIFIYYLNRDSSYYLRAVDLLTLFIKKQSILITSVLTLTEILALKATESLLVKIEEDIVLMPNLQLVNVDRAISRMAARIRRMYDFALVDSVQLATALENNAEAFITNDKKMQSFKGLKIILLSAL